QIPLGPLQTNAYVIWNHNKDAIVIDPGGDGDSLVQWLKDEELKPLAILLTHAHYDHIGAVDDVRDQFNCPVYIHENEQDWLLDPSKNGSGRYGANIRTSKEADEIIREEGTITIGPFSFQTL